MTRVREASQEHCSDLAAIVDGAGFELSAGTCDAVLIHARSCIACQVSVHPALARFIGV
jgi:hypothetical protein